MDKKDVIDIIDRIRSKGDVSVEEFKKVVDCIRAGLIFGMPDDITLKALNEVEDSNLFSTALFNAMITIFEYNFNLRYGG